MHPLLRVCRISLASAVLAKYMPLAATSFSSFLLLSVFRDSESVEHTFVTRKAFSRRPSFPALKHSEQARVVHLQPDLDRGRVIFGRRHSFQVGDRILSASDIQETFRLVVIRIPLNVG